MIILYIFNYICVWLSSRYQPLFETNICDVMRFVE